MRRYRKTFNTETDPKVAMFNEIQIYVNATGDFYGQGAKGVEFANSLTALKKKLTGKSEVRLTEPLRLMHPAYRGVYEQNVVAILDGGKTLRTKEGRTLEPDRYDLVVYDEAAVNEIEQLQADYEAYKTDYEQKADALVKAMLANNTILKSSYFKTLAGIVDVYPKEPVKS